jgi:hypothetical protein
LGASISVHRPFTHGLEEHTRNCTSQLLPEYCGRQEQEKEPGELEMHVPPFEHGLGEQRSTLI